MNVRLNSVNSTYCSAPLMLKVLSAENLCWQKAKFTEKPF